MERRDWTLAWVMGVVHFSFHFFMRIVPPLMPILALELGLSLWKLGLLVSLYFVGSTVGLLPAGVLADTYDRRVTLTAGLVVVCAGYVGFAAAPTVGPLLPVLSVGGVTLGGTVLTMNLAMFLAGVGTSVHIPAGVPIITTNASEGNRGKLLGIWGGASKVGDAATPAVVGTLILAFAWTEIVLAFAVLGLVYAVAVFGVLGLDRFETVPVVADGPETDDGREAAWRTDRRTYLYPMATLVLYFAGYQIAVQGVVAFTPTFVATVYDYSFAVAGVHFAPESFADFALSTLLIAGAVSRFGAGVLVDRYDYRKVLVGSLSVAAVGLWTFTVVRLGPLALLGVLVLFGGALWGNTPARDALISDLSPTGREGRTFSYLWTASRGFGALSPVLVGYVADTADIQQSFGYLVGAVVVAGLSILFLFSDRIYVDKTTSSREDGET